MSDSLSRRAFLGASSCIAAGGVLGGDHAMTGAPAVHIRPQSGPIAVASGNGLRAVERAGQLMAQGVDTLDAAIEGVKIQELDPEDSSVGYGGLPSAESRLGAASRNPVGDCICA